MATTNQQWRTFSLIACLHFARALGKSLQGPFFPREAETKGSAASEYGFVFGVYDFTAFLCCPLIGKYMNRIGAKNTGVFGLILIGVCYVVFGLLDLVQEHATFIGLCFAVRILESVGNGAGQISAFSITTAAFSQSIASAFSSLEIFYGIGSVIGPIFGGFLFIAGGYITLFTLIGLVILGVALLLHLGLPSTSPDTLVTSALEDADRETLADEDKNHTTSDTLTVMSSLKVPSVQVNCLSVAIINSTTGFFNAILEPFLREFALTPMEGSITFALINGTYASIAPLVGVLCGRGMHPQELTLVGTLVTLFGCLIVGPAPFINVPSSWSITIFGLILVGIGRALIMVSCFVGNLRAVSCAGYRDDIVTYGVMASVFAASFSLGSFIGPSVAGVLYDQVGFKKATYFILGTQFMSVLVVFAFIMFGLHAYNPSLLVPIKPLSSSTIRSDSATADYGALDKGHPGSPGKN